MTDGILFIGGIVVAACAILGGMHVLVGKKQPDRQKAIAADTDRQLEVIDRRAAILPEAA